MLETNIDDMNPEFYGYVMEMAFGRGALDAFMTPIIMKKNRPGIKLSILANEIDVEKLEELVLSETTTLGLRKYRVDRQVLDRRNLKLSTPYGTVSIKVGYLKNGQMKFAPEYEECKEIAQSLKIPIKKVYEDLCFIAKKHLEAL